MLNVLAHCLTHYKYSRNETCYFLKLKTTIKLIASNFVDKYSVEHGTKEQEGVNQNWLPTREC